MPQNIFKVFLCTLLFGLSFDFNASESVKLPDSIIIAVQPSRADRPISGPINSIMLKMLMGVDTNIKFYMCPWARCLKALETGVADIVDDLYFSEQREQYMHFLKPEYATHTLPFRFFALKNNSNLINRWDDLYTGGIATVRGTVYFPEFDSDSDLLKYETVHINDAVNLVLHGRVETLIAPPALTTDIIRDYDPDGQLIEQTFSHSHQQEVFIGVSRKSPWIEHIELLQKELKSHL